MLSAGRKSQGYSVNLMIYFLRMNSINGSQPSLNIRSKREITLLFLGDVAHCQKTFRMKQKLQEMECLKPESYGQTLNESTKPSQYPLPDVEKLLERLQDSKIFSTLDLRATYWQISLKDEDACRTAFSIGPGYGIYEFVKTPFGRNGAP
ncbi:Retrovirus-related Pol polyprotein from transposon opus [Thelohanellus kitauei]|uniref:Retrovirus-related Pol polyprotein from transposon opus n=1 Tax=Thelohanellus kitauei TaxID=669202 RepID=A0A0C2MRR3_THEKT|nr:Retrovirus-related Pol polyprotein from transposon opus [Thelohanellus kitauei]